MTPRAPDKPADPPIDVDEYVVEIEPGRTVSARHYRARPGREPSALALLAHGAGGTQLADFMCRAAAGLAQRGVPVVTFNFAYAEERKRVPDKTEALERCFVRVIESTRRPPVEHRGQLVLGGKSMGGRIATHLAASTAIDPPPIGVVVFGYPLHPPGRLDRLRVAHLAHLRSPVLVLQGTRDAFGSAEDVGANVGTLPEGSEIVAVEGGDHSFRVRRRAGIDQDAVYEDLWNRAASWITSRAG